MSENRGRAAWCLSVALLVSGAAIAGDETLTLRVSDAVGVAGGRAAIVLSTYASRPIGEGQLCLEAGGKEAAAKKPAQSSVQSDVLADDPALQTNSTEQLDGSPQTFTVDFLSPEALVNATDGPLAVFHIQLDPDLAPGDVFDLQVDLANSNLVDAKGQPIALETKPGQLTIRDPAAPVGLEIGGDTVEPGGEALVAVQIDERLLFSEATVTLEYDPAIVDGDPVVELDPLHGETSHLTDLSVAGRIRIDVLATFGDWNQIPGDLIEIRLPTAAGVAPGTVSAVRYVARETSFLDSNGTPVNVQLEAGSVTFGETAPIVDDVRHLLVDRRGDGTLDLSWEADCGQASYAVYRGDLAAGYESLHRVPGGCSVAGLRFNLDPQPIDGEFFLVVPVVASAEGTYGVGGPDGVRARPVDACHPASDADEVCSP